MNQRVAIVTGASRGIGAAIAERLASDGCTVVVNFMRRRDEAERVVCGIERAGGVAIAVQANVADKDGISALFDVAEAEFGGVDILVNNVGFHKFSLVAEVTDEDLEAHIALNIGTCFRGMREGARRIRESGSIISLSTSVVGTCPPTYAVYAGTKAAVEVMTRVLAKELAPRSISVNAVAPGPVETEGFLGGKSDAQVERIVDAVPFKRLGQPSEIASVVSFLTGRGGSWVSGQVIRANGAFV